MLLQGSIAFVGSSASAAATSEASGSPLVVLFAALLAGSIGAATINAIARKRSGEGPASAADSLSRAAGRLGEVAEDLVLPTQRENVRLMTELAELRGRYAERAAELQRATDRIADAHAETEHARSELRALVHRHASELTARDALLAASNLALAERDATIADLRVAAGLDPGRRNEDPEEPPAPGTGGV